MVVVVVVVVVIILIQILLPFFLDSIVITNVLPITLQSKRTLAVNHWRAKSPLAHLEVVRIATNRSVGRSRE